MISTAGSRHSPPVRPCWGSGPGSRPAATSASRPKCAQLPHGRHCRHWAGRCGSAQQRSVRLLDQVDLDQARPGGTRCRPSRQARRCTAPPGRAAGKASPGDIDEIEPAGLVDLRLRYPAQDLPDRSGANTAAGGRVRLAADESLLHRSPPWLRWPGPLAAEDGRAPGSVTLPEDRPARRAAPSPRHG